MRAIIVPAGCRYLAPYSMGEDSEEEPAADVLTLLDFYWFHHLILSKRRLRPPPPPPPPSDLDLEEAESHTSDPPPISRLRSPRDELDPSPEDHRPPKLRTILSGKEGVMGDEIEIESGGRSTRGWRRGRRRRTGVSGSRSLSELEFEELKGFMDLGFTFSEAEADPRLMEIVPGLQRLRAAARDGAAAAAAVAEAEAFLSASSCEAAVLRPYLSEVWDVAEREEEENNLLRGWRIPAAEDAVDMKNLLKHWAHTVASTVR